MNDDVRVMEGGGVRERAERVLAELLTCHAARGYGRFPTRPY